MVGLERVAVVGVTNAKRSVVATTAPAGRPVVLVHGILDSVRRWVTKEETDEFGLALPDRRLLAPVFQPDEWRTVLPGLRVSAAFPAHGLLTRLAREGIPAVGFSYQDARRLVANMTDAVAALASVVAFARERWRAPTVDLVGFSRGGLVCRTALADPDFAAGIDRLVTVGTPHLGSSVASWGDRLPTPGATITVGFGRGAREVRLPLEEFATFLRNLRQLAPDSDEVRAATAAPPLPGGYFAAAGERAAFFRAEMPLGVAVRLPPPANVTEFTEGKGDFAVSVASALAIPSPTPDRVAVFPFNHHALAHAAPVHDRIVGWLRHGAGGGR